jgi:quercetin dioxygenase-like cupin family protein
MGKACRGFFEYREKLLCSKGILNIQEGKAARRESFVYMYAPPQNLHTLTLENTDYRRVHETYEGLAQLVLMSIPPGGSIPEETHPSTLQFIRSERGTAKITRDGQVDTLMEDGHVFILPGVKHEVVNDPEDPGDLKLYTIYYPPEHPKDLVQAEQPVEGKTEIKLKTLWFYTGFFPTHYFARFPLLPSSTSIN